MCRTRTAITFFARSASVFALSSFKLRFIRSVVVLTTTTTMMMMMRDEDYFIYSSFLMLLPLLLLTSIWIDFGGAVISTSGIESSPVLYH